MDALLQEDAVLLRVVTQYQERNGVGKGIEWTVIASQVAKAGVAGRDNKSCRLRQELLNPTPAQAVHARLDVFPGHSCSCISYRCTAVQLHTVIKSESLISTGVDVINDIARC